MSPSALINGLHRNENVLSTEKFSTYPIIFPTNNVGIVSIINFYIR